MDVTSKRFFLPTFIHFYNIDVMYINNNDFQTFITTLFLEMLIIIINSNHVRYLKLINNEENTKDMFNESELSKPYTGKQFISMIQYPCMGSVPCNVEVQ